MSALEELIQCIVEFTPEQLDKFLHDPLTVSILQVAEESEPCPLATS